MSENIKLDKWKKDSEEHHFSHNRDEESMHLSPSQGSTSNLINVEQDTFHYIPATSNNIGYVGFWRRWFAMFIDSLVLFLLFFVTTKPIFHLLANALYYILLTSSPLQGTLGKAAIGAIVVDKKGRRISFFHALGRYLSYIPSSLLLGIGFIMVAFHSQKRGLHDIISGTLVINKKV